MTKQMTALGKAITRAAGKGVVHEALVAYGELNLTVKPDAIVAFLAMLRDNPEFRFQQLIDLTCVDYPDRAARFDVVYHLLSLVKNVRVRVKIATDEQTAVPTIVPVHPCADWFEREAFDMFGVMFEGHPDLRRLLTDYGFTGHPLRKDFPMTGYVEVRWDEEQKRVVYEPVKLNQEFRQFDFLSPWEGADYPIKPLPGDEKARGG
jgi:NADH-quinone oxidoreductase subunit C